MTSSLHEPNLFEELNLVHALRAAIAAMLAASVAIFAVALFLGWRHTPQLALLTAAANVVALVLSRSGWTRSAMLLPLLTITYTVLHLSARSGGIENIGIATLPLLIVLASVVWSLKILVWFTTSTILAAAGMLGVRYFVLKVERFSANDMGDFFIFCITCASAALVGRLLARRIEESFQRVRDSERRYRGIFESVQDVYCEMSTDGVLLELSPASSALFGVPREGMVGSPLAEFCANGSECDALLEALRRHGRLSNRELVVRDSRGERRTVLVNASLQTEPKTGEGRVIGSIRDITERILAEEALRESEARLRLALDATGAGTFDFYPQSGKMIWSEIAKSHFGMSPETEVDFDVFLRAVHPDDRDRIRRERAAISLPGSGGQLATEFRVIGVEDGRERWIAARGRMLFDREGRPARLIGTSLDISERKQAEEALRDSERRLREAQEVGHTGYFDWDIRSNEIVWSEEARRMYGFDPGECSPTLESTVGLVPPEDRERVRRQLALALDVNSDYDIEHRIGRPDGKIIHVHARGKVTRGADGTPLRMLGTVVDITERKRDEEEKERLQLQLVQAQKMESIGRLAGGVAHDFNNLLTVINGYAAFLSAELAVRDPLRAYALEIGEAGEHAARLTSQLLAFSRKQAIRPKPVNLNAVLSDAERMLERLIGDDIELVSSPAPGLGLVMADPDQIHQIVMNLAVNARDAMPNGGKLGISTADIELDERGIGDHPDATPGRYVQLTITDTGEGMTEEVRRKIFEPFFTTKEKGKGTGLGLAMVYGIVRQNDGWIEVKSEPGRGSMFRIYLPRIDAVIPDEAKPAAVNSFDGDETVLVVEDQEAVRRMAKRILEAHGYHILEAGSGAEAHAVASQHAGQLDLLLTDVVMPGMDGHTLSQQLRDLRPNLRVILMSGYAEDVIAHRGSLASGLAYIQKPFRPEELTAKVREILDSPACS
jgi:two-component system cell cycle sensor histidine kinase/response regulator CckA